MTDLLASTPAAQEWVNDAINRHSRTKIYGKIVPAIIWTELRGEDGELVVPVDPLALADDINSTPYPLLRGHDPGKPIGQLIESSAFRANDGLQFIAAVLGYYAGGNHLIFNDLNINTTQPEPPPKHLPTLPEGTGIQLLADPREVGDEWLTDLACGSPLKVHVIKTSHNAAETLQELITIGLPYVLIVWNPLVTAIASEAGKAVYAGTSAWLKRLLGRLKDRKDPILSVQSFHDDCEVSFLFRGKDIENLYSAHEAFPYAAVQAARLVERLKQRSLEAQKLVYEFDRQSKKWYPSYSVLRDGRIITEKTTLISIEQLPSELSLGLNCGTLSPEIRRANQPDNT